jgi:hypothetical protein
VLVSKEGGTEEHKVLDMMAPKLVQLVHRMELVLVLKLVLKLVSSPEGAGGPMPVRMMLVALTT